MATIEIVGGIKDHFTMIPNDIFRDPNISPRAVKVYGFLRSHASGYRTNVRGIATQMGWNKDTVNKAIRELEECGFVSREWKTKGNIRDGITYRVFDSRCPSFSDTDCPSFSDTEVFGHRQIRTHKEDQFLKEDQVPKEDLSAPGGAPSYDQDFEEFWKSYPRKTDKVKAQEKYREQRKEASEHDLLKAVANFREEVQRLNTEMRYLPMCKTWLNQQRWRDYVDYQPRLNATAKHEQLEDWISEV